MDVAKVFVAEKEGSRRDGADVAVVEVAKLRPLNASASPPKAFCDCVGGDGV